MSVLFIGESQLKESSYISDNVDMKVITPTVIMVQDIYIHPILGTALYTALQDAITLDDTLAAYPNYYTLLKTYIHPVILWYVVSEIGEPDTFKYGNKSVGKKSSDNAQAASMDELIRLAQKFRQYAEFYAERLTRYLQANQSTFPEYYNQGTRTDAIRPKPCGYETGIYLGDTDDETQYLKNLLR